MKLHEYQAKELLKTYRIPVQDGLLVERREEAEEVIKRVQKRYSSPAVMVKAQIHAGGRGKGGGVKYSPDLEAALKNVQSILGMNLITHQTGPQGQQVHKVFVTQAVDIAREFYAAVTLDRARAVPACIVSSAGGMEIEQVAAESPEKIHRVWIDPLVGLQAYQARHLAHALGLEKDSFKSAVKLFLRLYTCYHSSDATLVEINPLVLTETDELVALDAKLIIDDNALFRQPELAALRDEKEEDPTEVEASRYHLNYIKLEGQVGCMVNGAGLAMATMDIIKLAGGEPANFLDVGGTAQVDTVKNGFRILLSDERVRAVLINIFGGIVRCDRVARGVVEAVRELRVSLPVVVRLEGTNAALAREILGQSGLSIIPADSMQEAAHKVVQAVGMD